MAMAILIPVLIYSLLLTEHANLNVENGELSRTNIMNSHKQSSMAINPSVDIKEIGTNNAPILYLFGRSHVIQPNVQGRTKTVLVSMANHVIYFNEVTLISPTSSFLLHSYRMTNMANT